jgi:uncharacterized integral membrane protein
MSESTNNQEKKGGTTRLIIAIIILALTLVFVFSNMGSATLHFLGFRFVAPGWIWFFAVLAAGVVIGSLFPWFRKKKK